MILDFKISFLEVRIIGKFINRYNNYNCIEKNDTENIIELSHYTSNIDALVNICSGEFWATDIQDFGDKNEGKLILHRVNEIVTNLNQFTEKQREKLQILIGSSDAIDNFISEHRTSVLSMCLNINSEYMWKNYARENGYNIIFDKRTFIDTLHFYTAKGEKKENHYIKHAKIIYSVDEQVKIIEKEIADMLSANEFGFDDNSKVEYILQHLMYVGNFYKNESSLDERYIDEQEYRILINTSVPTPKYPEIAEAIPKYYYNEKNKKHYNILKFDRKSIKEIICNSDEAKKSIEKKIIDIPIRMRNENK